MIGSNSPARPVGFGGHLENEAGRHAPGWRAVVAAAGWAADELTPPMAEKLVLDPLVRRALAADERLGLDLDVAVNEYGIAVFDAAVLLGAALARTWPAAPDELEAWPARALAYAGLATSAASRARAASAPPAEPSAEGKAPPFEGETIADLVERSGSIADGAYGWLELAMQTLWEESPHHAAFDGVDHAVVALAQRDAPVPLGAFVKLDNARIHEECTALSYAVRAGYALGAFAHLPEPERVARARALANLHPVVEPHPLLTLAEWDEIEPRRRGRSRPAPAGAGDADAISAWLADHALADAPPAEAIARLLADREALERLRPTPTTA